MKRLLLFLCCVVVVAKLSTLLTGCAQVISPTGGKRDTIPPKLVIARPALNSTNISGNRITLNFDEYIVLDRVRENLLVSPTPKLDPNVDYKLKTVSIRLRDTLQPNTTYAIDLGNSIKDNNEGNILRRFRYVFSTGSYIDSLTLSGKVKIAETGKPDSTLQVYLYKNLDDSAVNTEKPKYIARLDSSGNFIFKNLAPGTYNIFALKDGDGQKTYNSKIEMFAFADKPVVVGNEDTVGGTSLYAFQEEKDIPKPSKTTGAAEKKLKVLLKVPSERQDINHDLVIEFNKPLKTSDLQKVLLTDTLFNPKVIQASLDSTSKKIMVTHKWQADSSYVIIIPVDVGADSTGLVLAKADTVRFKTKAETDYGSIKIKFKNFSKSQNAVLQFIKNDLVYKSYPITSATWSEPLFDPGEYDLRILFDQNNNGLWDPGNFGKKLQPEKVFSFPQKLSIKANWDNERDIEIPPL